ncbi:MAG: Ion-translocating oxidoreductase complex subunit E [Sodalis sp.]|nr:MAG: Ion-translocating oxidoreductase complex subunit E [Sodalis sp.]
MKRTAGFLKKNLNALAQMPRLELEPATALVLVCTHAAVSGLRRWIHEEIRIPIYVMIIASLVSTVQMLINAYAFSLCQSPPHRH